MYMLSRGLKMPTVYIATNFEVKELSMTPVVFAAITLESVWTVVSTIWEQMLGGQLRKVAHPMLEMFKIPRQCLPQFSLHQRLMSERRPAKPCLLLQRHLSTSQHQFCLFACLRLW